VATGSGHFRSCSAKSRSLTITSPVGYRWWTVCPYDEILAASDRNSFFLFRSARLARATSLSKARKHITAIPRAEMINATHQWSGIEEKTFARKFMEFGKTESDAKRNTSRSARSEDYEGVVLRGDSFSESNRRNRRSQSRQAQTIERGASRSSTPRLMSGTITNSRTVTPEM
jgi:hypothetical protein